PPLPKFFHGRESELAQIVKTLQKQPAHLAILGPGGMGKTTLAVAALHHPDIISKYEQRHFISCESAFGNSQLVDIIAAHLGLEPSKHLSTAIVGHFINCGTTLLVLDNLETSWEDVESRVEVEDLLALLSGVPQLALLITMRGAERPARVKWTRTFLPPLEPLHSSASRQTFIEIADVPPNAEEGSDLEELLRLSGNLPLAVSLMAAVASYEGYSNTLHRWETENYALLSDGHDKKSNPRMLSSPNAKRFLILLSFLPDGLCEIDMRSREALDIPNILQCRAVLLRTSLAYMEQGRLKVLSPIRQYIKSVYPPPHETVECLRRHWESLLTLWKAHKELPSRELVWRLTSNLGNIDSVTQIALSRKLSSSDKRHLMRSILGLDLFTQCVLNGKSPFTQQAVHHIQSNGDRRLRWEHICSCLDVVDYYNLLPDQAEVLIEKGIQFSESEEGDPSSRCE
ncbi:P-loop containing nucleoside triphosphate hydrolase protein, partial [Mycena galopus ATCC 62051]